MENDSEIITARLLACLQLSVLHSAERNLKIKNGGKFVQSVIYITQDSG